MLLPALLLAACSAPSRPRPGHPLDYRQAGHWAARPETSDAADKAWPGFPDGQATALADTFYVHPTTYGLGIFASVGNAPVPDADTRSEVDQLMAEQATAFNGATRVFAPRYRQASGATFSSEPGAAEVRDAFDVAYGDVLAAFNDYMERDNGGRPIVLAGHSQGGTWLVRLLRDRFDGKALADRLVVAYVIGEFIGDDTFAHLPACTSPDQRGCVVSWATAGPGGSPRYTCGSATLSPGCTSAPVHTHRTPLCVNPLTWATGPGQPTDNAEACLASGPLDGGFVAGWVSAWCDGGLLRINDTVKVAGVGSVRGTLGPYVEDGDYHVFDVMLFFGNLRADVARRVQLASRP